MFAISHPSVGRKSPPAPKGATLVEMLVGGFLSVAILSVLAMFLMPVQRSARPAARRSQCKNNLKQLGLALHNYVDEYGVLPPAYTVDADGKPLHSWRTLILPYMDQKTLYDKIDLTKPWDDPANAEPASRGIEAYCCPSATCPQNHATYMVVVTETSCFRAAEPRKFSDITDGLSNTLMLIEVDSEHSVPWMSPRDADESLIMALGSQDKLSHNGGMHITLADGTVRFVNASTSPTNLRALISIAGNERIDD